MALKIVIGEIKHGMRINIDVEKGEIVVKSFSKKVLAKK
jgi:hypothetical protein